MIANRIIPGLAKMDANNEIIALIFQNKSHIPITVDLIVRHPK